MLAIRWKILVASAGVLALAGCGDKTARNDADAAVVSDIKSLSVPAANEEAIANTVVESVRRLPDTTDFMSALTASGVGEALTRGGPYTLFVPTDSAFDSLPPGEFKTLTMPENKARLAAIVNSHVVDGTLQSSDLRALLKKNDGSAVLKTRAGSDLTVKAEGDMITVTDNTGKVATIGGTDIAAGNGTVHLIDKLLAPGPA